MKKLLPLVLIIVLGLFSSNLKAQTKKTETITIKTSTQCGMCKERIEKAMAYEKGVVSSELDVDKQLFSVIYKPTKTSPEKIKQAISKVGYDADNIKADTKAYEKLPGCCQKGGHFK